MVRTYRREMRLSDAHVVVKQLYPIESLMIRIMNYKNFELFVRRKPVNLERFTNQLRSIHAQRGGRCEIRIGKGFIGLDFAIRGRATDVDAFVDIIDESLAEFGLEITHVHAGKFIPSRWRRPAHKTSA